MSTPIPKFQFNNNSVKTDSDLEALTAKSGTGGGSKYLDTGVHQTAIQTVEYVGAAPDSRWGKFKIVYEGTGNKTTSEFLLVPFGEVMYRGNSGKDTMYPFQRVQRFMKALGVDLKVSNLQDILTEYFSNPSKSLVGQNIAVTVGYEGNHVKYLRKNPAGELEFGIVDKDGQALSPMVFPDRVSATEHAEQNQIQLRSFPAVLNHATSNTPTKKVSAANW